MTDPPTPEAAGEGRRQNLLRELSEQDVLRTIFHEGPVTRPQIARWVISGFVVAITALALLEWGPDKPSTTHASVSMTMAFAVVALTAVNLGDVLRREREAPWSSPVFPWLGWIILGWILTWAAVELNMLQRLLDTTSLKGGYWVIVLALSLITPAIVGIDKALQRSRLTRERQVMNIT